MQIVSSQFALSSQHQASTLHETHERLILGDLRAESNTSMKTSQSIGQVQVTESRKNHLQLPEPEELSSVIIDISNVAIELSESIELQAEMDASEIEQTLPANLAVLKGILEKIFGKSFNVINLKDSSTEVSFTVQTHVEIENNNQPQEAEPFSYDYSETYHEEEQTQFNAAGVIKTADGKEIDIAVNLNMSRSFSSQFNIHADNGVKVDPLVINFDGNAVELGDDTFSFDINADGVEEELATLTSNSGFLALDKNNDGIINNGKELFGPNTGNGFLELAQYDEDGNQFIDENDSVFNGLQIMQIDSDGNILTRALLDLDIGAIYTGYQETPFSIKSQQNEILGEIVSTGVYINENGQPGTVQQIDFVI